MPWYLHARRTDLPARCAAPQRRHAAARVAQFDDREAILRQRARAVVAERAPDREQLDWLRTTRRHLPRDAWCHAAASQSCPPGACGQQERGRVRHQPFLKMPSARRMKISMTAPTTATTNRTMPPVGARPRSAGDPEAHERADDADQHVGDPAHLRVGLHDDARQPADHAADDQGDDQSPCFILPSL